MKQKVVAQFFFQYKPKEKISWNIPFKAEEQREKGILQIIHLSA